MNESTSGVNHSLIGVAVEVKMLSTTGPGHSVSSQLGAHSTINGYVMAAVFNEVKIHRLNNRSEIYVVNIAEIL